MVRLLYYSAALLCSLGALAHEFFGAPKVLAPLADTGLSPDVIWLHHFSWHVGTLLAVSMAAMFVLAARRQSFDILAFVATALSVGLAALAIGLALFGNSSLWSTPAPYPWSLVAALGAAGLLINRMNRA